MYAFIGKNERSLRFVASVRMIHRHPLSRGLLGLSRWGRTSRRATPAARLIRGDFSTRIVAASVIVLSSCCKSEQSKEPTAQGSGEDCPNASRRTASNISLCNKSHKLSPLKRNCTRIIFHRARTEYDTRRKTKPRAAAVRRDRRCRACLKACSSGEMSEANRKPV